MAVINEVDVSEALTAQPSSSFILTLPNDILSHIFLIHFQVCRDDESLEESYCRFKDQAVFVTHVCKRWRWVALNYAPIWAFIVATSSTLFLEQIELYLARSKNSLLVVYLSIDEDYYYTADSDRILPVLRDHVWRIKEFHLFSGDFVSHLQKYSFLLDTAQNLRYLSLYCENRQYHEGYMPTPAFLNSEVVSCQSSSLRELVLYQIISDSALMWLNTITSLTLSYMEVEQSVLLPVLAQCSKQLESLSLHDVNISGSIQPLHPTVYFLVLHDLTIFANLLGVPDLSRYVKFPKCLNWKIVSQVYLDMGEIKGFGMDMFEDLPTKVYPENEELRVILNGEKQTAEYVLENKLLSILNRSPENQQNIVISTEGDCNYWPKFVTWFLDMVSLNLPPRILKLELALCFNAVCNFKSSLDSFVHVMTETENLESLKISLCEEGEKDKHICCKLQLKVLRVLNSSMFRENESDTESEGDIEDGTTGSDSGSDDETESEGDSEDGTTGSDSGSDDETESKSKSKNADTKSKEYWPKLEVLTLDKFYFGEERFLDKLINFLSSLKKRPGCIRLNIDDAHALSRDSIDIIRTVFGGFYLDGVEIAEA